MQHKAHPSELCAPSNSGHFHLVLASHTAVAKSARTSARDLRYAGNPQGRLKKRSRYWVRDWRIAGMFSNGVYVLATCSSARHSWPRLALHKEGACNSDTKTQRLISRLLRVHSGANVISATGWSVNIFHPAAKKSRMHRSLRHAAASLVAKQANWYRSINRNNISESRLTQETMTPIFNFAEVDFFSAILLFLLKRHRFENLNLLAVSLVRVPSPWSADKGQRIDIGRYQY